MEPTLCVLREANGLWTVRNGRGVLIYRATSFVDCRRFCFDYLRLVAYGAEEWIKRH